MSKRSKKIIYTAKHRKAFRVVEKELLGRNTFDGYTHDLGKLIMLVFCPFISVEKIKKIHKEKAKHHNAVTRTDYIQKIIDYECSRLTKPDKQQTAREYVESNRSRYTEEQYNKMQETLRFLGL